MASTKNLKAEMFLFFTTLLSLFLGHELLYCRSISYYVVCKSIMDKLSLNNAIDREQKEIKRDIGRKRKKETESSKKFEHKMCVKK